MRRDFSSFYAKLLVIAGNTRTGAYTFIVGREIIIFAAVVGGLLAIIIPTIIVVAVKLCHKRHVIDKPGPSKVKFGQSVEHHLGAPETNVDNSNAYLGYTARHTDNSDAPETHVDNSNSYLEYTARYTDDSGTEVTSTEASTEATSTEVTSSYVY